MDNNTSDDQLKKLAPVVYQYGQVWINSVVYIGPIWTTIPIYAITSIV